MPIPSNKTLERLLDYSAIKQKVIGQNIANAETQNYKRREVEFKDLLDKGMMNISKNSNSGSEFNVIVDEDSAVISDGNNVDVNKEMSDMAQNSIMFKFAAKKLNSYYQSLQGVIRGGN